MNFDPNGPGQNNGNFVGLPFDESSAKVVLLPLPWEVTVSYRAGTAAGPDNLRQASRQLDLYDPDFGDPWKVGIYLAATNANWRAQSDKLRHEALGYISALESGETAVDLRVRDRVNAACELFCHEVYLETKRLLAAGKFVGLLGGDHSTPLGYIQALCEAHPDFGILHLDAHCDLRQAYEGFEYSHASIFYNVLKLKNVSKLVQFGIRDFCDAEAELIKQSAGRVQLFGDSAVQNRKLAGEPYSKIADEAIAHLPKKVYISFDIDALDPSLCPSTGTPVPGGLSFSEAIFLIRRLWQSGREIIGFDLSEIGAASDWDGNVAARIAYKLIGFATTKP